MLSLQPVDNIINYNIVDIIARSNSLARACIHNSMVHARAPSNDVCKCCRHTTKTFLSFSSTSLDHSSKLLKIENNLESFLNISIETDFLAEKENNVNGA